MQRPRLREHDTRPRLKGSGQRRERQLEGIRVYIQKLKDEFSDAMYMCGARKVSDIDGNMIRLTK